MFNTGVYSMKMKTLFLLFLFPSLLQAEHFDHHVLKKYIQENLSLLEWRDYKQMGYGVVIGATILGAGYSVLTFNDNVQFMTEHVRTSQMQFLQNGLEQKGSYDPRIFQKPQATYFNSLTATVSSLSYNITMGLTSAAIVAFAKNIASKNGVLKNVYSDIIAAFTKPDVQWYIEHYVPLYEHLDSFKYCAVYFDMNSPFLIDVHSDAITLQYIQSLIESGKSGTVSGYAHFLQRKAEVAVGNAQELLQYDECLAAYRHRKNNGHVIEEDSSLLAMMHELHANIVEDLEKILGFIYALPEYHKHSMTEFEKEFLKEVTHKMRAYADHITFLLNATEAEREQASMQGNGMFTSAHEFELYCKTIFRS